jgi:hypothetical protein
LSQADSTRLGQSNRLRGGGDAEIVWSVSGQRSDYGASNGSDAPLPPGVVFAITRSFQKICGAEHPCWATQAGGSPLAGYLFSPD